jgi:acetylornithine deacetylase/succinyl-diaminopimelate desuccinylase-like protein
VSKAGLPARLLGLGGLILALIGAPAAAEPGRDDSFLEIYRELVETDTTHSAGSCTLAAERMAARLRSAGFSETNLHLITVPAHPNEGSLVAILPGRDPDARAILLLAHLDVVEARRDDWQRDPFTLVEEEGYFYARGASDDKAQAAVWVDTLIRLHQAEARPRRTIKMALTCGEETVGAYNGARDLVENHRPLIDAEFALNEGVGGLLDPAGEPVALHIQAGEKFPQDFRLEARAPGGHSSRPVPENAIYRLADALVRLRAFGFPIQPNEVTRAYFGSMAGRTRGTVGRAMAALAADPADTGSAETIARADPAWNALLRTTCVATMLEGGHAVNALPQRAAANVNCRLLPGVSVAEVRALLERAVADPQVTIATLPTRSGVAPLPPLSAQLMGTAREVAAQIFPGVPLIPVMATGGTDAAFLTPAGIPTYGITGFFVGPEGNNAHGVNERMRVRSLMEGRRFLYALVGAYAER